MSLRDPRLIYDEEIARDWHARRGIPVDIRHSAWPHSGSDRLYGDIIGMFTIVYENPSDELRWREEFNTYYRSKQCWIDRADRAKLSR